MKKPKRHFFNHRDYILDYDKKVLIMKEHYHSRLLKNNFFFNKGFKKLTATRIAPLFFKSEFISEFEVFCSLIYLQFPILEYKYIIAGEVLEPKIINFLSKTFKYKVKTFEKEDINYDLFPNNKYFGGIPDGIINKKDKKIVLEIKTTNIKNKNFILAKKAKKEHILQASLYAYLLKIDQIKICYLFLNNDDYENLEDVKIEFNNIHIFDLKVDFDVMKSILEKLKKWFIKYTSIGISPKFSQKDQKLLEFLKCRDEKDDQVFFDTIYNNYLKNNNLI